MSEYREQLIARLRAEEAALLKNLEENRTQQEALAEIPTTESHVVDLDQFLSESLTDFDWLFGGVIPTGSIGLIVADGGVGKTTLLVQAALCLAAGKTPFRSEDGWETWRVTRPVPTLYVLAEGSRAAFQARVRTAAQTLGVPRNVNFWLPRREITDYKIGSANLERMIRSSKAGLVILDTLGYFHSGEENSATDWKQHVMNPLRGLTSRYGCAFIIVHHQVKATEGRTGWQKGRGSSAMFDDADFWLRLEPVEGDTTGTQRILYSDKIKYGICQHTPLNFNARDAVFTPVNSRAWPQ